MSEHRLRITGLGLIGDTAEGDSFRYIQCEDTENSIRAEFMLSRLKKPLVWKAFLNMEEGKSSHTVNGYITRTDNKNIVVIDDDKFESIHVNHPKKQHPAFTISRSEAEEVRKKTTGYRTNLTAGNALETGWRKIDKNARRISFRRYVGNGNFSWDRWYDITG